MLIWANGSSSTTFSSITSYYEGLKQYELSNHLGNVLATISDRKIGMDYGTGTIVNYHAVVNSETDYYPFGMEMEGRRYAYGSLFRLGFNNKENDDEVEGVGNWQDYGIREYLPRLGKFISVDPLFKKFPYYSSYQFSGNKPIYCVDLDGKEDEFSIIYYLKIFLGIGPAPKNADEASQQANIRNTVSEINKDVHKYDEEVGIVASLIPGGSALYQKMIKHDDKAALVSLGVDVAVAAFGGKLLAGGGKALAKIVGPEALNETGKIIVNIIEDVTKHYKTSFKGGDYVIGEATQDFTVYRVAEGPTSKASTGEFFSLTKPKSAEHAEELLNINTWGNTAETVTPVTIKKGQQFAIGQVEGGKGVQILIPKDQQAGIVRHLDKTTNLAPK